MPQRKPRINKDNRRSSIRREKQEADNQPENEAEKACGENYSEKHHKSAPGKPDRPKRESEGKEQTEKSDMSICHRPSAIIQTQKSSPAHIAQNAGS